MAIPLDFVPGFGKVPNWYVNICSGLDFVSTFQCLNQRRPGARATKHISIEFEIRWKFRTL